MTRSPFPHLRVAMCAAVAFFATTTNAAFASPFETHKPGVATTIEINPQIQREETASESSWEFPLELITPVRAGMEFSIEQKYAVVKDSSGTHRGLKDLEIAGKTRLLNGNDNAWGLTLGMKPTLSLPTGSRRAGLSDHTWSVELPVYVGRKFGATGLYAEATYEHVFGRDDDEYGFSTLVLHELWDGFEVGAEVASKVPGPKSSDYTLSTNIGVLWTVAPHLEIQTLLGRTIRTPDGHPVKTIKMEFSFNL